MKRYSHWIDINLHEDCAGMYETHKGIYVLNSEAQEKIDEAQEQIKFLVSTLQSLQDCNEKLQPPGVRNEFISKSLQGFIHE